MTTLQDIAYQAMVDRGFQPDFSSSELQEVASLRPPSLSPLKDLREKLFFSIDNDDSLDLDQLTYAEKEKIFIAIADVSILVSASSAIDQHASHNTTSVYTPAINFPMLPPELSTDLTSLNPSVDRQAIIVEMNIALQGDFTLSAIYPALVHNHAKLTYKGVGAWLEKKGPLPPIPGLAEQVTLQDALAQRMKAFRLRQGALSFKTIEVKPTVRNGVAVNLEEALPNRANALIENFMIAANVGYTRYLLDNKVPIIKRIVRTPERWNRIVALAHDKGEKLPPEPNVKALRDFLIKQQQLDPLHFPDLSIAVIKLIGKGEYVLAYPGEPSPGHFDLALEDYAHTTAPNRRYPDLIMQRLLKHQFSKTPQPYSKESLATLATHCTEMEDNASKVERRVKKSAAAMVLGPQIGRQFSALVTGATEKGTWVRLITPPIEGKLVKGFKGVDVGDAIAVKLIHVDVQQGFIDFARV